MKKFLWTPPVGSWRLNPGDPTQFDAWRIAPGLLVVKNLFLTRNKYKVTHEHSGLAVISNGFPTLKKAAEAGSVAAAGFNFDRPKDAIMADTFKDGRQVAPASVVKAYEMNRY